jgi:hypothetical protein
MYLRQYGNRNSLSAARLDLNMIEVLTGEIEYIYI